MSTEKKIVMIFGTFDYLHAGHENYIQQAREQGDYVIAVVARDKTVEKVKSRTPDRNEKERMNALKESGLIDKVVLGDKENKHKVITKYKPNVIALGYDQFAFTFTLKRTLIKNNLNTEILRLKPYRPELYKSSIIRERQMTKKHTAQQSLSFI